MRQIYVHDDLLIPYDELEIVSSRSGGPGGQHVNTTESRVQVRFDVAGSRSLSDDQRRRLVAGLGRRLDKLGGVRIASQKHRSQIQNREAALSRLAEVLREALHEDAPRRATRPSRAQRERRLSGKHKRAEIKRRRTQREED